MIDPFSTQYWPSTKSKANSLQAHPTTASKSRPRVFAKSETLRPGPIDLIPKEFIPEFKQAVMSEDFETFSKVTMIELLMKKFPSCSKQQIRTTLDHIAYKGTSTTKNQKTGRKEKRWLLK